MKKNRTILTFILAAGMAMAVPQMPSFAEETETEAVTEQTQQEQAAETSEDTASVSDQAAPEVGTVLQTPVDEAPVLQAAGLTSPQWTWSSDYTSAQVTLTDSATGETQTFDATIRTIVLKPATCGQEGKTRYFASYKSGSSQWVDWKDVTVEKTSHNWGEPQWTWSEDHTQAQATFTCLNDDSHTITVDAAVTKNVIQDPTCTEDGAVEYTATADAPDDQYTGDPENLTATVTASIPATGHDWGDPVWTWNEDNTKATITRVCNNDPSHIETADAQITYEDKNGKRIYTATAVLDDETFTDTKETDLPKDAVRTAGTNSRPKAGITVIKTKIKKITEPQTGDSTNPVLWGGMMAAGAGLAAFAAGRKKKAAAKEKTSRR